MGEGERGGGVEGRGDGISEFPMVTMATKVKYAPVGGVLPRWTYREAPAE